MSDAAPNTPTDSPEPQQDDRRTFFTAAATLAAGAIAVLTPLAVGMANFLTPLFRRKETSQVRVALLDQVPDDGAPHFFPVITDRRDAWNRYPSQRVGAVYLVRRPGETKPLALTAQCPHAGCFVGYTQGDDVFKCPCHTSRFHFDGSRAGGDAEVAPRGMDELPVELKQVETDDGQQITEVWVEYIEFQTGHQEAIPTV